MKKIRQVSFLALALATLLLFSSCLSSRQQNSVVRTIEVTGTSEVVLQPDIASFSIQVQEQAPTTGEAQALANAKMAELLAVLRKNGVADKDITTTGLTLRPNYDWIDQKQVLSGQLASQSLSVTLRNLASIGTVIDQLGQVSSIQLDSVRFDKEDKTSSIQEARKKAVDDAFAKAEMYATSSFMKVGKPVSISESSFASNGYSVRAKTMLASESLAMGTEVPTGSLTVSASISMVFEMY
ncbi:SIMPL domain-containing protein [uncultured Sphaerochaeta sp.]|uniref:SIMPL domain-containing protein n=1 Tax=uncultured Sphaerochaeta sp. TaxID=886478 RepID=UPI002A0A68A5|nr:SIMPL domain-containing protein [uncultured Sphaerochaeta sp.]